MDTKSYAAIKKIANRVRLKYILITLAIWCATFALFFIYHFATGAKFTDPSGIAWVLMLMIPFAFKLHRRIIEKEWTGEIRNIKIPTDAERSAYLSQSYTPAFLIKNKGYNIAVLTVHTTTQGNREVVLVGEQSGLADSYYMIGDRVTKFAGLKYPVNYTTERGEVFCPICGNFNDKNSGKCYVCKSALADCERHPEAKTYVRRD